MGSIPSAIADLMNPTPGLGLGWTRVADAVRKVLSEHEVRRIWVFPPLRHDGREWGTAVVTKVVEDGRSVVFTAKYMLITRGRQRGRGKVEVDEVGEGPVDVVHDVIRGVQDRAGEGDPPVEIGPQLWFSQEDDQPTAET